MNTELLSGARTEIDADTAGVTIAPLRAGTTFPAVVAPTIPGLDIVSWTRGHQAHVHDRLREHGALLFRGLTSLDEETFQELAGSVCASLYADNGEHDRTAVSPNVYSPIFYPPEKQLLWHNENSFNFEWPGKICFGCVRPAATGGETPLVDSRTIARQVDRGVYRRFLEKRVMYVRNYVPGLGAPWSKIFQTDDRQRVEAIGAQQRMQIEWTERGLRTVAVRPAIIRHPETGAVAWVAQVLHWHPACLDPQVREVLLSNYGEDCLPRDCRFGDGTRIEDGIILELLELYREAQVVFAWQRGDVAVLDNLLTAHGRNPFTGERRLLVALGDLLDYDHVAEPH